MAEYKQKTLFNTDLYSVHHEVHTPVVLYESMGRFANLAAGVKIELQDLAAGENDTEPRNDTAKDV